jgi:hypothetical protein
MTTVNVRIERLDSGDRLYLPNGMWGRATSVLARSSAVGRMLAPNRPVIQGLTDLYAGSAREQNELVRVVATRIGWDGTMQSRMVDTAHCSDGPQWEDLADRALTAPHRIAQFPAPRLPRWPG